MANAGQSHDDAHAQYYIVLKNQMDLAVQLHAAGDDHSAAKALAIGMHALQDSFAPQHADFAEWSGNWGSGLLHFAGDVYNGVVDLKDQLNALDASVEYIRLYGYLAGNQAPQAPQAPEVTPPPRDTKPKTEQCFPIDRETDDSVELRFLRILNPQE